MKRVSIRLKITAWFAMIMILITAAAFCMILWADYSVLQKTIQDNLIETVEDNADEVEFFRGIDKNESDHNGDLYIAFEDGFLEIDDDFLDEVNGITTALYRDTCELLYGENPVAFQTRDIAFQDRIIQQVSADSVGYYVFDCMLSSNGTEGLWLRGVVSEHQGDKLLNSVMKISAALLPVLLLLAIIGGYWISHRALRPVQRITEAAAQISQGRDLKKRIALGEGEDELHQLANVFDDMFSRLDKAFQAEQQFTSDVSHELRTPMSVIMAQCEYTLEEIRTEEEYTEALTVIQRQGRKMSRLIEDMLCFTRMEQNSKHTAKEQMDISELTEDICTDMALLKTHGITLIWETEPDVQIYGNRMLLGRLLTNLISNGYNYGKENGTIHISLRCTDEILLTVTDDGIGISPEHQEKIFERFYRSESARSTEGTGLGLAMVREIAEYHGGYAEVSSAPGKGSKFTVHLPKNRLCVMHTGFNQ